MMKRLRDNNRNPIGRVSSNPILNSRLYELGFLDGYETSMSTNLIVEFFFTKLVNKGQMLVLFEEIASVRSNQDSIKESEAFFLSPNGTKTRMKTTEGWSILTNW